MKQEGTDNMAENNVGSVRMVRGCLLLLCFWSTACDTSPRRETRIAISPANLTVELINVKFVNGKYRYFCSIHNVGSTAFSGAVKIESVNKKGDTVGGERFTTTTPIEPGLRQVVYLDQHTGPPDVHGDYGVTSFRLTVE